MGMLPTCKQSAPARHYDRGSALLEGLLAILIFSVGLLAILMLLAASLVEVGNARYRAQASLLASNVIAAMWTGDRSLGGLRGRYGDVQSATYQRWHTEVLARLPGITGTVNPPSITIDDARHVNVTLRWQAPGDAQPHQLVVAAIITD